MKEKIKEFLKDGRKIIIILFFLQLLLNIFITPNRYDDEFFIRKLTEGPIIDFVSARYSNWTSRVLIEFVLCTVLKMSKYAWVILQTLMMTLLGYSVTKLFVKDEKQETKWMAFLMILIYPLSKMSSAGWGATTVNYIWPFAMAMFAMIPIRKIFDNEKIKWYMYPLYSIALIFAGNQEQTAAIVFGAYLIFTILLILRDKKKTNIYMIIQLLITIASLVFILTCPGNSVRRVEEVGNCYPDFETLSFLDKISLGVTSTFSEMLINSNICFLVLSIMIVIYIYNNYKDKFCRTVAVIPITSILVLGIFKDIVCRIFPYFDMYKNIIIQEKAMITADNYTNLINFLPLITSLIIIFAFILSILLIFKKLRNNVAIVVFIIGLGTRIMMALSPTIFASTNRTFIFFEFSMLIVALLIWQEMLKKEEKNDKKIQERIFTGMKIIATIQYINTLLFILITKV